MVRRSTWIALAILVVLLGMVWYMGTREEPVDVAEATPTAIPDLIFNAQDAMIVGIKVVSSDGKTLNMEDKGIDGWQVIEPELAPADPEQVFQLTNSLMSLRAVQVLDNPPGADSMQLAMPAYMVTITWSDGRSEVLEMGRLTPTNSGYYGRLNDGKIILVPVSGITTLLNALETPPIIPSTPTPTAEAEEPSSSEPAIATPTPTP